MVIQYEIEIGDTYNYDETGIRMGIGKKEKVITTSTAGSRITAGKDTNRESATVGETISGDGSFIPPIVILSGATIQRRWVSQTHRTLPGRYLLAVTPTAYINDEILLGWARHFEVQTRKRQIGKWRLLILDGHSSHFTKQFIQFCDDHLILLFATIPHTTHITQPLDVVVFQPYKHWYGQAISKAFRLRCVDFDKIEFLQALHKVRLKTFKRQTILSAWRKTGLIPFNPQIVLDAVQKPPIFKRIVTPPLSSDPLLLTTPENAIQLKHMSNIMDDDWPSPVTQHLYDAYFKGSIAIAVAADAAFRDLKRQTAAALRREQSKKDSRRALQTGGLLYVQDGRDMCDGGDVAKMQAVADRLDRMKKIAANKAKREQLAVEVAQRKVQKAYNKKHGIVVQRGPYIKR